jgi:hypothetical protein
MMSEAEEPFPSAKVHAAIKARLTAFDRHKKELLSILCNEYERQTKGRPFDKRDAWRRLRFAALVYLLEEASVDQKLATAPANKRIERLRQFGNALSRARRKADEVMSDGARGHLFLAWCEANGDPDLLDPILVQFDAEFDKVVAGLAALETAAFRAAEQARRRRGRPDGTAVLPHDCIIALEAIYRDITLKKCGAGPRPFARLVKKFF